MQHLYGFTAGVPLRRASTGSAPSASLLRDIGMGAMAGGLKVLICLLLLVPFVFYAVSLLGFSALKRLGLISR